MAKTFEDLASRTMTKANRKRAAERTKVLLLKMPLSERRTKKGANGSRPDAEKPG